MASILQHALEMKSLLLLDQRPRSALSTCSSGSTYTMHIFPDVKRDIVGDNVRDAW